jgi:hypothetical protein
MEVTCVRGEQFMTVRQHGGNLMIISRGKSNQHDSYLSSAIETSHTVAGIPGT